MNSEQIASWLTVGANIGVLIGLAVLIVELRQDTGMMRAQMLLGSIV